MDTVPNVVVLLSGGVDSSVLLHSVAKQNVPIHALCVNYGQRHFREIDCARRQAAQANVVSFEVLDMRFLGAFLGAASSLIQGGPPVPTLKELSQEEREQPSTYVPNRNMMLLSVAAAYAESIKADTVYYGAQAQDNYGYWDCTTEFLERLNAVLSLNRRQAVHVEAPLIHHSKADNVRIGLELKVDFGQTWSCYRGELPACGVCPTCIERLDAFACVSQEDPLPYASR